ncbi:MAG: hypothetical protein IPF94_11145 [Betaproteobacteria bacterium]|nr:hypothetical protein [Betaproteobacteria bacterium]
MRADAHLCCRGYANPRPALAQQRFNGWQQWPVHGVVHEHDDRHTSVIARRVHPFDEQLRQPHRGFKHGEARCRVDFADGTSDVSV